MLKYLCLPLLLLPLQIYAHNLVEGQKVAPITITDRGELLLAQDEFSYRSWASTALAGKVRIVQYIAGRRSAKKKNKMMIKAIEAASFPEDRFQPTTIVNTDDEFPGTGYFVLSKIEKNKRNYPWAQFIIDSDGKGRKAWALKENSSTIIVLDAEGHIQWAKDGPLSAKEVYQVLGLLKKLINTVPR